MAKKYHEMKFVFVHSSVELFSRSNVLAVIKIRLYVNVYPIYVTGNTYISYFSNGDLVKRQEVKTTFRNETRSEMNQLANSNFIR